MLFPSLAPSGKFRKGRGGSAKHSATSCPGFYGFPCRRTSGCPRGLCNSWDTRESLPSGKPQISNRMGVQRRLPIDLGQPSLSNQKGSPPKRGCIGTSSGVVFKGHPREINALSSLGKPRTSKAVGRVFFGGTPQKVWFSFRFPLKPTRNGTLKK